MKVRKSLTAVGAALVFATISVPAMAARFDWDHNLDCSDPDAVSAELVRLSEHLRCAEVTMVSWPRDNPIWEKARSEELGCTEVHESLADKLWVKPPRDDVGNPDGKGKGPKQSANEAEGAAQKVLEEKYGEAIDKLIQLRDAVDKSKLNNEFEDTLGNVGAKYAEPVSDALISIINDKAIPCVNKLLHTQP